jgi:hypothetical protein
MIRPRLLRDARPGLNVVPIDIDPRWRAGDLITFIVVFKRHFSVVTRRPFLIRPGNAAG